MFDKKRAELISRLDALVDRYRSIQLRAIVRQEKAALAARMGFPSDDVQFVTREIIAKMDSQIVNCCDALKLLRRERALPFMFTKAVGRAEAFAEECDFMLKVYDDSEASAKLLAKARFGDLD